jgi:glycosyltransferase involved in cell wall biosynthesis
VDLLVFEAPTQARASEHIPKELVRDVLRVALPAHSRKVAMRVIRNGVRLLRATTPLISRFGGFEESVGRLINGRSYELGVIEHFWCAPYARLLAQHCGRLVLDLHNVESELHRTCARTEKWPHNVAHHQFSRASARLERAYIPRFSSVLTASADDAAKARTLAPRVPVLVYPNALPETPLPAVAEEHVIAFSGNLEYHPNQSAVRYFATQIWPRLHAQWPAVRFRLIGKNPRGVEHIVGQLPSVELTGPVEDAVAELARAAVVVVPLLAGSGTRLKILEAWAAGRAVVSTTIGAEGLAARDGDNIVIRDTASSFADAVSMLLESPEMRHTIGVNARAEFERSCTWASAWPALADL